MLKSLTDRYMNGPHVLGISKIDTRARATLIATPGDGLEGR